MFSSPVISGSGDFAKFASLKVVGALLQASEN